MFVLDGVCSVHNTIVGCSVLARCSVAVVRGERVKF